MATGYGVFVYFRREAARRPCDRRLVLDIRVPKVYNLSILLLLSVETARAAIIT